MPTLTELRKAYAKKSGQIERQYLSDNKEKYWSLIHLRIEFLFKAYTAFLNEPSANKTEFELFFDELVTGGAPVEVMICAASAFPRKKEFAPDSKYPESLPHTTQTVVDTLCKTWDTTIHLALQFATIEYITDMSKLGTVNWTAAIMGLLHLKADPGYPSSEYSLFIEKYKDQWLIKFHSQLNRTIMIAMSSKHCVPDPSANVFNSLVLQQKKFHPEFTLSTEYFEAIMPGIQKRTCQYHEGSWFRLLESHFPTQIRTYIIDHQNELCRALAKIDGYLSIEYFRVFYGINSPLTELVNNPPDQLDKDWMQSPWFQYLDTKFHDEFIKYLKDNYQDFLKLRPEIWRCLHFYEYLKVQCSMDVFLNAFSFLMTQLTDPEQVKHLVEDSTFKEVETRFSQPLKAWLYNHTVNRIRIWRNIENSSHPEQVVHFALQYNLDPYRYKIWDSEVKSLSNFLKQQCELMLSFIFQQSYPNAIARHAKQAFFKDTVIVTYLDKKIIVSKDLASIIDSLINTVKNPEDAPKTYFPIFDKGKTVSQTKLEKYDEAEHDIYLGLSTSSNFYKNGAALGTYVLHETNLKRNNIMPFLMGFSSPDSSLHKTLSKSPIYDKRLLGEVFSFLGDYSRGKQALIFHNHPDTLRNTS